MKHATQLKPALPRRTDVSAVYEATAEFVWLTLQRLGMHGADLEDLTQDVFLVVHRKLHLFEGESRLTTWLFAICRRVVANHRRRAHVRREYLTADSKGHEPFIDVREPDQLLGLGATRTKLLAVLDSLNAHKRAVFVMFEVEGMSCAAIATQLGIPLGTVHSRLNAARRAFAKAAAAAVK